MEKDLKASIMGTNPNAASTKKLILLGMPWLAIGFTNGALNFVFDASSYYIRFFAFQYASMWFAPVAGKWSDRRVLKGAGSRHSFLVPSGILMSICVLLLQCMAECDSTLANWLVLVSSVGVEFAMVTMGVPTQLFLADVAGDRQITASASAYAWFIIGDIFALSFSSIFYHGRAQAWVIAALAIMANLAIVRVVSINAKQATVVELSPPTPEVQNSTITEVPESPSRPRGLLIVCWLVQFLVAAVYGFTNYDVVSAFLGYKVYQGDGDGAYDCKSDCTPAQREFLRGGDAANAIYWIYYAIAISLCLGIPTIVSKFGAKQTWTASVAPEILLIAVAFCPFLPFDGLVISLTAIADVTTFVLVVPIVVHAVGSTQGIGLIVGCMSLAKAAGYMVAAFVMTIFDAWNAEEPFGVELVILIAGVFGVLAFGCSFFFLKTKLQSK